MSLVCQGTNAYPVMVTSRLECSQSRNDFARRWPLLLWTPSGLSPLLLPTTPHFGTASALLPADGCRVALCGHDVFMALQRPEYPFSGGKVPETMLLQLVRNGKPYLFQDFGTERDPPIGKIDGLAATAAGVVMVNRAGVVFLVRHRTAYDTMDGSISGMPDVARTTAPAPTEFERLLIETVAQIKDGKAISTERREMCSRRFGEYCGELTKKNHSDQFDDFPPEDNVAHYLNAWRMAVINREGHGGWPLRHGGRYKALEPIRQRLAGTDDPFLMAAVIIPALENGEIDYAVWTYRKLARRDAFWARQTLAIMEAESAGGSPLFISHLKEIEAVATRPPPQDVYRWR